MTELYNNITLAKLQSLFGACVFLKWPLGKKGDVRRWKHLTQADMTPAYLVNLFDGNIGIALGRVSDGLCAIDIDTNELTEPFRRVNPWSEHTTITRGARGCQIWVRIQGEYPPSAALKLNGRKVGEWRADGNQSIVPPSIHPDTGRPYEFLSSHPVVTVPYSDIDFISLLQIGTDIAQIGTDSTDNTDTTQCFCKPNPSQSVPICNDKPEAETVAEFQYRELINPFIPTEKGSNHRLLFALARHITHLPAHAGALDASQVFAAWYAASEPWTRQNKTVDEYRVEFFEALKCVEQDDLSKAWQTSATLTAPGVGQLRDADNRRLAALCFQLGQQSQNGIFYLSCRSVAQLFGIHHTDGARRLKLFANPMLALLEVVTAGTPTSGKASRYRYIGKDSNEGVPTI